MPKEVECDNCGFTTVCELFDYPVHHVDGGQAMLCKVCSGSFCSHGIFYPRQCDRTHIIRSLAYCTNAILKAIKENKKE